MNLFLTFVSTNLSSVRKDVDQASGLTILRLNSVHMTDSECFRKHFCFHSRAQLRGVSTGPGCVYFSSFAVRITHGPWVLVQREEETTCASLVRRAVAMGSNASLKFCRICRDRPVKQ